MIEKGLFAYLSQDAGVRALITSGSGAAERTRLYPLIIPQNGLIPCGVYKVTTPAPGRTYCATDKLVFSSVQLDSYARTYEEACALARAFHVALLDFKGMMGDVQVKDVAKENEDDFDDPEPGLFRRYQSWGIWFKDP